MNEQVIKCTNCAQLNRVSPQQSNKGGFWKCAKCGQALHASVKAQRFPRVSLAVAGPLIASAACIVFVIAFPVLISNWIILFVLDPGVPVGALIWPGMYVIIPMTMISAYIMQRSYSTSPTRAALALMITSSFWTIVLVDIITTPAFVIRDGTIVRMRLTGSSPLPYLMKNGQTVQLQQQGVTGSLIINDSPQPARLEEIYYSKNFVFGGSGGKTTAIGPYSVVQTSETIDHWGPDDRPPHSVSVSRGSGGATRRWLTW